jgi:acetolactate synthase-1/3 small subunit
MATMKHMLVALVEDKPGVLTRMVSLFRRRGFNIESIDVIESINVGSSELPHYLTRLTIVVGGEAAIVEHVRKQLERIVDVVKVSDITSRV